MIKKLEEQSLQLSTELSQKVGRISFIYVQRFLEIRRRDEKIIFYDRHKQKLLNLGLDISKIDLNNSIVRNLSSRILSDSEKCALNKGLNYSILSPHLDLLNLQTEFENLYQEIRPILQQPQRTELKRMLLNFYSKYKSSYFHYRKNGFHNISQDEENALKSLKNDSSIVICKPDKGQGVVILDKHKYVTGMNKILEDKSVFKLVEKDNNLSNLAKFQRFLYRLKKNNSLDDEVYQFIRPTAAATPSLYGLPKIHKQNTPLRPILSTIGSYSYQSSVWLNKILDPLRKHPATIKDSFEFVEKITQMPDLQNRTLASFDAKNLFTNIPLKFTIDIILRKLFPDSETKLFGMNKNQFKKLLNWTCINGTLQFNGKFYQQIDGVAMGSPLAPAFADIFMNWVLDEISKKSTTSFKIYRYVDDLFLSFNNSEDIDLIFDLFNSIHSKLKFTKEIETNSQISFLDVYIIKTDKAIQTKIYRKPTFTGCYMKWNSYVPLRYKQNLVLTLLERAYKICNSYTLIHKEFERISDLLQRNGFPKAFIDNQIYKFLNKKQKPTISCQIQSSDNSITSSANPKLFFLKLPYLHILSTNIKKEINRFFHKTNINARFVLINETFNIGKYFSHKDRQLLLRRSNVVYKINCSCGDTYIGQTKRNLINRLNEHIPKFSKQETDVTKHLIENSNHKINANSVKILSYANNWRKLLIKETLFIQKLEPNLNIDQTSTNLFLFNT